MLTKRGIAYNLEKSPYEVEIEYQDETIKYKFSSLYYVNMFNDKLESNRNEINRSLSNRFGFTIQNDKISDLRLYSKVEKRGFLIETSKEVIKCLDIIKLGGLNKIQKNSTEL